MLGTAVELEEARPIVWISNKVYKFRKLKPTRAPVITPEVRANLSACVVEEEKVLIAMKYSSVRVALRNILIPRTAAARGVINAWWAAVDRQHVTDPNIMTLPREWSEHEVHDGTGEAIGEIKDGVEIFLSPKAKTSPEVLALTVTWDGFDVKGLPLQLSIYPQVHRSESRNRLLLR
jgi:hypothetical protein